ncbi:hypothetical protein [Paraburkholderia sp. D1E]|uniref:hypothetical protein n=1 Tax=Paraburkholderia sp. D1E TaxID=3461398 RepID=UPI004045BB8F
MNNDERAQDLDRLFNDGQASHSNQPGKLVRHTEHDDAGREIRTWTGDKSIWMDAYKAPRHLMTVMSHDPAWNRYIHAQRLTEWGVK